MRYELLVLMRSGMRYVRTNDYKLEAERRRRAGQLILRMRRLARGVNTAGLSS